ISSISYLLFFFNATATTEIYTLSLHDALPISISRDDGARRDRSHPGLHHRGTAHSNGISHLPRPHDLELARIHRTRARQLDPNRSEEHTSELQSLAYLVCRLLLEKKKKKKKKK